MKRSEILEQIAWIAAQTPEGVDKITNPRAEYTVTETTGRNSWIRHEGIMLSSAEQQKILTMIADGSFKKE